MQPLHQRARREFAAAVAIGIAHDQIFVGLAQRGVEIQPIACGEFGGGFSHICALVLQFLDLQIVQQAVVLLRAGQKPVVCADDEERAHAAASGAHHVAHHALIRRAGHNADVGAAHALFQQAQKARAAELEFAQDFAELIEQRNQQIPNLRVLLHLRQAFFLLQRLRAGFELTL